MSLVAAVRPHLRSLALVLAFSHPNSSLAQDAWVPPRGEFDVSLTYQWLEADRHLFSGFTDPELTPFEIATGVDRDSNVVNAGIVQSHSVSVDADLGLTDRLAVSGSLIAVAPRYIGNFGHPGTIDDGLYHPSIQDARFGARYMIGSGTWAVTPFAQFSFPVRDYAVLAHASQGLGLNVLEVGASAGRVLALGGRTAFLQTTYAYGITEQPVADVPLNRSRAVLEGGVFVGRFSLLGQTSWRTVHGGLEWSDHAHGLDALFEAHDQLAATREWRYGGGLAFDVAGGATIYVSIDQFAWGANTHDARTIGFGLSLAHQMFGGLRIGD